MNDSLFSIFLKLELESVFMKSKIELTKSINIGLDIKYTPFELVKLMESQVQVLLFFDKTLCFPRTIPMSLVFVDFDYRNYFFMFRNIEFDINFV